MISGQNWFVHRVVKITFHGLPKAEEAWQVHHLDGNRANNCLENLKYVTNSENICYSFSNPLRRSSGPALSKPVLWRSIGARSWTASPSVGAAAQQLGMAQSTVSQCCRQNTAAKGYEFRYQEQGEFALPGEDWRPVVEPASGAEAPGRMVSSLGRITSQSGLISRGHLTRQGYYTTELRIDGLRYPALVHRLVAFAFLGPPTSDHQTYVNHKDLDKGNNAVDNLEWVSQTENMAHYFATSTLERRNTGKPVWSRPHGTNDMWTWHHSMSSAANELGLSRSNISKCVNRLQRQTSGYEFCLVVSTEREYVFPGEEWREIDLMALQRDKETRRWFSSTLF